MADLFKLLVSEASDDVLKHYGVKGMKWGEITKDKDNTKTASNVLSATKKAKQLASTPMRIISSQEEMAEMMAALEKANAVKTDEEAKKSEDAKAKTIADMDAADLVKAVIRGDYGNGADRKKALGDRYREIQDLVNAELAGSKTAAAKKTTAKKATVKKKTVKKKTAKKTTAKKKTAATPAATTSAAKKSSGSTSNAKPVRKKAGIKLVLSGGQVFAKKNANQNKIAMSATTGDVLMHSLSEENQNDFLTHYGVLGMKWGVRRDQGTLDILAGRKEFLDNDPEIKRLRANERNTGATQVALGLTGVGLGTAGFLSTGSPAASVAAVLGSAAVASGAKKLYGTVRSDTKWLTDTIERGDESRAYKKTTKLAQKYIDRDVENISAYFKYDLADFYTNVETRMKYLDVVRAIQESHFNNAAAVNGVSPSGLYKIHKMIPDAIAKEPQVKGIVFLDPGERWSDEFDVARNLIDPNQMRNLWNAFRVSWDQPRYSDVDFDELEAFAKEISAEQARRKKTTSEIQHSTLISIPVGEVIMALDSDGFVKHITYTDAVSPDILQHSMSDIDEETLSHHGVLGMKWGVRKARSGKMRARATLSRAYRKDQIWAAEAQTKIYDKVYRKAASKIRRETRALNRRNKDQDFRKDSPSRRKYYQEYSKMVASQLNASATLFGQSPNKKYALNFTFDSNQNLAPKAEIVMINKSFAQREQARSDAIETRKRKSSTIKHSDVESEFSITWDMLLKDGFIEDVKDPVLQHSMSDIDEDELMHYGILGMKWGVRRSQRALDSLAGRQVNYRDKNGNEASGVIDSSSSSSGIVIRDTQGYVRKADRASTSRMLKTEIDKQKNDAKKVSAGPPSTKREDRAAKKAEIKEKRDLRKAERQEKKNVKAAKRLEDIASGKIKPKNMTPVELKARSDRLQMEKLIKVLEKDLKGDNYLSNLAKDVGKRSITDAGTKVLSSLILQTVGKKLDPKLFGMVQAPAAIKMFKDLTGISVNPLTINGANTGNQYNSDDALKNQVLYELLMNAGKKKD